MPYPTQARYRLEISGHVGSGGKWATGINVQCEENTAPSMAELQSACDSLATYTNTFWADGVARFNAGDTGVDKLTMRWYAPGASASSVLATHALLGVGGASGANSPASTAIVLTLQSETAGASGRGRMYWPATAGVNANHSFVTADMQAYLDAAVVWINHIYTLSGNPWGGSLPSVLSIKDGALHNIVSLAVDGRPDRQESREDGLVFNRLFATA